MQTVVTWAVGVTALALLIGGINAANYNCAWSALGCGAGFGLLGISMFAIWEI